MLKIQNGVSYAQPFLSTNSSISPGWQSSTLQIVSSVLKRTAFAFPVFKMDRLANVSPTFSESSFNDIFLLAIITSRFTIIGMAYTVNSFSVCNSIPLLKICAITKSTTLIKSHTSAPPRRKYCTSGIFTPCLVSHSTYLTPHAENKPISKVINEPLKIKSLTVLLKGWAISRFLLCRIIMIR